MLKAASFFFFSLKGTDGSPKWPDPKNRVRDEETGSQGKPVSSGLQMPCEPGHCRARTKAGWVSRYAATLLMVGLSPGHSDITTFRPWSSIAT